MYLRTITEHQNVSESLKNKLQSVIPGAKLGHPYFIILQTRFFMGLKKQLLNPFLFVSRIFANWCEVTRSLLKAIKCQTQIHCDLR